MMKPEMTVNECAEAFRANRLSVSKVILTEEILAGKFHWAHGIRPAGRERAVIYIYTHPFFEWLEEMLGHPARGKHMFEENFGKAE